MALTKRISRVGNSAGMTFDQPILKQVGWEIGTKVEITVKGQKLILTPRYATNEEARKAGAAVVEERRELIEQLAKR